MHFFDNSAHPHNVHAKKIQMTGNHCFDGLKYNKTKSYLSNKLGYNCSEEEIVIFMFKEFINQLSRQLDSTSLNSVISAFCKAINNHSSMYQAGKFEPHEGDTRSAEDRWENADRFIELLLQKIEIYVEIGDEIFEEYSYLFD